LTICSFKKETTLSCHFPHPEIRLHNVVNPIISLPLGDRFLRPIKIVIFGDGYGIGDFGGGCGIGFATLMKPISYQSIRT